MKPLMIDKVHKTNWQKRWDKLHEERFSNDFRVAELAHEIRAEFPKGDAGDLQFCAWASRNLRGCRLPKKLLEKAEAYALFDEKQWVRLGGWMGITFLLGLTLAQRHRVMDALHGDGPFHRTTIRLFALKLGITAGRKTRDTRSDVETRINTLRLWLAKLYKMRKDLPPMPKAVQDACTPGVLSALQMQSNA